MSAPWMDPELAAALAGVPAIPALDPTTLGAIRDEHLIALQKLCSSEQVKRTEHPVRGPAGAPDLTIRVHVPVGIESPAPCLFYIHGGGYVMGHRLADDPRFERWCPKLGLIGVSVEYRLAPETPYPGPLHDCDAALTWVYHHAAELGIDHTRIGVGGSSAGAGLAAALAILTRDRGELPLMFQLLSAPMIDDRKTETSGWDGPTWRPEHTVFGWRACLGNLYGTEAVPPPAAPARAEELAGLPPTLIYVGTADAFCDEDVMYARKLYRAGVPTELRVYHGAPHGFEVLAPDADLTRRCQRDVDEWLCRHVARV